jgi:hypothetical protein
MPTGTMTGTDRWSSSPTHRRCPSNPPTDSRRHKVASPERSAAERIQHKCANHGSRWHQPESIAGPARENPYARASLVAPTGTLQCHAGFPGKSVGQRPWPGIARCMEMFARRDRHDDERRGERTYSRAGNPSAARISSFRRSWVGPPRKRVGEIAVNFKSTPRKIVGSPFLIRPLPVVCSPSTGQ